MSIEAMTWVLKLDVGRSSEKFVLVCLANYADQWGVCYPSCKRLMRDTGQDRKTVLLNLQRLQDGGLLRDTGQRVGRTAGVPVWELVGMPGNSRVHYTYRSTDLATGEFYIGKRSFNGDPYLDTYRGSGRWVLAAQANSVPLHKEVIEVFDTDEEARAAEMRLFREHGANSFCMNEGTPPVLSREGLARTQANRDRVAKAGKTGPLPSDDASGPKNDGSNPVIPASGPVIPTKRSQKGDTEPLGNQQEPKGKRQKRATAMRDSWKLPKAWGDWTLADETLLKRGWNEDHVRLTAEIFRDHWLGNGKPMKDWFATWRNWCRKSWSSPDAVKANNAGWFRAYETALVKANEVGVGPPLAGESQDTWHARIRAAIDNGGKPPAPREYVPPSPTPGLTKAEPRAAVSPENRAALLDAVKRAGANRHLDGDNA